MAVADASKWFTRQGGEPATAFISGSDGVAAVTQTYTDFEAADALLAPLASPTFTGVPAAPTAAVGTNTTQVATTAYVVGQAVAKSAVGNLLTANQASLESNATTGWQVNANCTIAVVGTPTSVGSYALQVTGTGASPSAATLTNTSGVPVVAGQTYTAVADVRSASATPTLRLYMHYYTAAGAFISTSYQSATVTVSSSAWQTVRHTTVAPATAAYVAMVPEFTGGANGEVFYVDKAGIWEGAGGQWALPGTPITNLGFYTDESVGRRLFQWDGNNARWQMTYGDTGLRDLTASITGSVQTSNPNLELKVRRVNSRVEWKLSETAPGSGSGTLSLLTADAGFRPAGVTAEREAMYSDNTGKPISDSACEVNTTGEVYLYGVIATRLNATVAYETTNSWPTTLPGSASGSIPA